MIGSISLSKDTKYSTYESNLQNPVKYLFFPEKKMFYYFI